MEKGTGLKWSIKYKNKLYSIFIKHATSYNINAYRVYKNKLTPILKEAEKVYYQTEIISNKVICEKFGLSLNKLEVKQK